MSDQEQENESSSLATLLKMSGREINDQENIEFRNVFSRAAFVAEEERKKEEGLKDEATGGEGPSDSFKNINIDEASGTDYEPTNQPTVSYASTLVSDLQKKMKDMDKNQQKLANDAIKDILEKGSMGLLRSQPVQKPSTSNESPYEQHTLLGSDSLLYED